METKIQELNEIGQSVWLDNISRSLIETGQLEKMIKKGCRGITSNPTIFEKAVKSGDDYDDMIEKVFKLHKTTFEIYDELTIKDVQDAADIFLPIYKETKGLDGYVSLEVNPDFSDNVSETIKEAKRLFNKVNRPNIMFKIPATNAGFAAIEQLLGEGININATLIFSALQYEKTAESYVAGIKKFLEKNESASKIQSVASIFVSRIDTMIDNIIDKKILKESENNIKVLRSLRGKAAVANSKIIYKKFLDIFNSEEFTKLESKGANIQRVLWASTSTKDPLYSDVKYVDELIAENTVNTMPESTFNAFLDHGNLMERITDDLDSGDTSIASLGMYGIDVNDICNQLLQKGVASFKESFKSLLNIIEQKVKEL